MTGVQTCALPILQTPTVPQPPPEVPKVTAKAPVPKPSGRVGKPLQVKIVQQSLTLGEERFYQAVWHSKETEGVYREAVRSRTFSLGYDKLARMVRLDEKSVRQLIPKLVAKQVLEVLASEDCAIRKGRTYRIFSYEEILDRQRAAGLQYVVKRGRAVEFVPGPLQTPTVGVTPTGTVGETPTDIVGVTPTVTVGVTPTPLVTSRDNSSSQTSTRQLKPVFEALQDYGPADIDAARRILNSSRTHTPDATVEEVVHFIHEKGRLTQHGRIGNPVAFLIVYVPKCFQGEAIISHRERQSARQREDRKSTRLNSSHIPLSRMPSSA